jgi:hypothetical protein
VTIDFGTGATIVPDSARNDAKGRITVKLRWPSGLEEDITEREVPAQIRTP